LLSQKNYVSFKINISNIKEYKNNNKLIKFLLYLNNCTKNKIYRDISYYYNVKYKIYRKLLKSSVES